MHVTWIAQGKLELWDGAAVRTVESTFARQVEERHASIARRHAWKQEGRGARFAAWGAPAPADLPGAKELAHFVALSPGRTPDEVLSVLTTTHGTCALLARDVQTPDDELRLHHSGEQRITGVAASPDANRIAVSLQSQDGTGSLGLLSRDGAHLVQVTEGESVDACPRWDARGRLLYQTAGIGRDAGGHFVARAPFAIARLDPARGAIDEVAADPHHDLLFPAPLPDGAVLCLRRPHRERHASWWQTLVDLARMPWLLATAVFTWVEFFVVRYTGKPFTTAGGARQDARDERYLTLLGNVVDVEAARRASLQAGDAVPAIVPRTWELVRLEDGAPTVLARGVLAFNVAPDGAVVWSNGSGVFKLGADGRSELLVKRERVEALCVR